MYRNRVNLVLPKEKTPKIPSEPIEMPEQNVANFANCGRLQIILPGHPINARRGHSTRAH